MGLGKTLDAATIGKLHILYVNACSQWVWAQATVFSLNTKVDRNAGELNRIRALQHLSDEMLTVVQRIEQLLWPGYDKTVPIRLQLDAIEREIADDSDRTVEGC